MTIDELAIQLDQADAEIKSLSQSLKDNHIKRLLPIITSSGKLKGELSHLTRKQYRRYMGKDPRPSILVNGKIPWHMALDELATEHGYKSDEQLKEAIEKTRDDVDRLDELKKERRYILGKIRDTHQKGPEVETVKVGDSAPVYPKDETVRSEVTSVNGMEARARRNPSFWQVEVDKKETPENPDHRFRVRYADNARTLVKAAVKDHKEKLQKEKLPPTLSRRACISRGRFPKISPALRRKL